MKHHYVIHALFHRAIAKHAHQTSRVKASNIRLACNMALKEILNREGIKGKRHQRVTLSIVQSAQDVQTEETE